MRGVLGDSQQAAEPVDPWQARRPMGLRAAVRLLLIRHRRLTAAACAGLAVAFALIALAPNRSTARDQTAPTDQPAPTLLSPGPGLVATPVRLADAETASLLHPGTVVDVLAATLGPPPEDAADLTGESGSSPAAVGPLEAAEGRPSGATDTARVVATGVRVLAVPLFDHASAPDGADADPLNGVLVVLATTRDQARLLAQTATTDRISIVLVR